MLKELEKCLKTEQKDKTIFDIVVYGSTVKGKNKPNDLDLLIIFKTGSLKERLDKIQLIKRKIKLNINLDIKGILWEELFQEGFFARAGIIREGISLFNSKPFAEKMGFKGNSLFIYNLKNKNHTEKVKFNYILSGRGGPGMVKKLSGQHLTSGMIIIPVKNSLEFEEILKMHQINYSKKNILIEE